LGFSGEFFRTIALLNALHRMRRITGALRCHARCAVTESRMIQLDDPHDDPFADAPPDPEFTAESAWLDAGTATRNQPMAFSTPSALGAAGESRFLTDWVDQHRVTTYPANPSYPRGSSIDVALDAPHACRVQLPYPAARCGMWVVTCRVCGYAIALTTAGRADDPCSVRVPCRGH
jgi:hypothetical protein